VVQQSADNPVLRGLKMLWYPFGKLFGFITWLVSTIIQEMLRSVVRFVVGIVLMAAMVAVTGLFVSSLIEVQFDFTQVLPTMVEQVARLFGAGG
jgi:hypothetical protein